MVNLSPFTMSLNVLVLNSQCQEDAKMSSVFYLNYRVLRKDSKKPFLMIIFGSIFKLDACHFLDFFHRLIILVKKYRSKSITYLG